MTNKIRRVTCVILALVLLLSANAYAVDDLGESTFTGTIIVDSESPKLLNLGEIEIEVYQSTPIETDESYTIYSEEYAFSVYPDENGIFTFDRPSSVFSITVQVDSLPDGYGISHHTSLYSPEITSDIFTLSIVDEAEIVADSLKYPEIMLFNADGEEVYAVYEFEPTYQVLPRNDDIVEISGTVNLNGDISYNVSSNVDLPELDAIGKVELLYDVGAIDEVERIEKYIEIYEDGTSGSICSTPIVGEILEFYESDEYQTAPASLKIEIENLIQTPEELSDDEDLEAEYPNSVSNSYFTVHYDDTVTKTVAQNTLNYLSTLRNKSSSLGFNAPINQSGYSTLQVYLTSNTNSEANGETYHSNDSSNTSWSYIKIYNLNGLSAQDKETVPHEYFHAVQNAYFKQNGWFKEAAAVWFAAKYSGSITRAKGQFEKYLSSPETTMQDTKYGNGVFPMAIDVAYGGSATIRKIYERLNSVGSKDMSETQLENAITWAIQQYDSSGSFAEAFKKLGAYITLPDHFFASVIPSNASWSNGHINRYTPTTTEKSISVTLESFGLKPFELRPNSSTSPQDLEVVIDFSGVRSTTNSVRFVKETASGSIIPFGTDATAVRYSAVINPFGNATSAANNIVDLYVAPINAGSYDRRINITYQLAG